MSPHRMAMAGKLCKAADRDVANPDGSQLRISTKCDENGAAYFDFLANPGTSPFAMAAPADAMGPVEAARAQVYFDDLNKDGYWEIIVQGTCGDGPNCLGEIYRWDRQTRALERFLGGGWAELQFIDGYLIAGSRTSCCSWEYDGYLWDHAAYASDADREITIEVKSEFADETSTESTTLCTFSRKTKDGWRVVTPPSPAWLNVCKIHEQKYRLEEPPEAIQTHELEQKARPKQ